MSGTSPCQRNPRADYSACVVLHQRGETFFVIEVLRGRNPFDVLKQRILDVKARYGTGPLLIEQSSISTGLIQNLKAQNVWVNTYRPETDKRTRLIAQFEREITAERIRDKITASTLVKNIRLSGDPEGIECDADKVKGLVLKTAFLKKA